MLIIGFTESKMNLCESFIVDNYEKPQTLANIFHQRTGEWPSFIVVVNENKVVAKYSFDDYEIVDI
jgi:hypothetical protein